MAVAKLGRAQEGAFPANRYYIIIQIVSSQAINMRKYPQFLFAALCTLLLQRILAQCCLKFDNQICTLCPNGMHLYRNNCIFDIPHCATYDNGFDCASCEVGYRLNNSKCEAIDYSDFVNGTLPNSNWQQFTDQQYQEPDFIQLVLVSQDTYLSKAGRINLMYAYFNSFTNSTFYRLIFSFAQGYLEHVYLKNDPVTNSYLLFSKFLLTKPQQKPVNKTSDPNVEICNRFFIQSNPSQMLQNSQILAAFTEKGDKSQTFYRIVYQDGDHGLRSFRANLEQANDYLKGRKKEVFSMSELPFTNRTRLLSLLGDEYRKYVSPQELKSVITYSFLNDSSKVQYILTFYHSRVAVNETEKPPVSYIDFTVINETVYIQSEYLYMKLLLQNQMQYIPKLDVNCSRKSSIHALYNRTDLVFEAYTNLSSKEALKNVIEKVAKCIVNRISQKDFITLQYVGTGNETTDIFKTSSIIMKDPNYTLIIATLSIDKRNNQITLIELISVDSQNYLVQSFYVENKTKVQQLLLDKAIYIIYEEHQYQQSEIISVCRFVEFRRMDFTTGEGQISEFVFKYAIKKPIIKKVSINYRLVIEANTKLGSINKDLNLYEYVEFTYRVVNGDYRDIKMLPITLFPPEQWTNAIDIDMKETISYIDNKSLDNKPLYQNAIVEYAQVSNDSLRRRVIVNVEDEYIFKFQLVYEVDFYNFFPPKLISKTKKGEEKQNCSPYPNCTKESVRDGLISYKDIQRNQILTGVMQFIQNQFAPQIEYKTFIFLKKLNLVNPLQEPGYQYFEVMYANTTRLQGLKVRFKIGLDIISITVLEQNTTHVGKTLLYICYKFYNTTQTPPESALLFAKTQLQSKVRAFQTISNKSIDDPTLQVFVAKPTNLTIIDTKLNKNYTFNSPLDAVPLITPIGQEKMTKFDDFINIRNMLEELLGIDRIGKISTETKEVFFEFSVVRRVNFYGAYDQILVSFQRGIIQRNNQTQIVKKISNEAQYFTFEISTPQKVGQTLIPRIFLSNNNKMLIELLLKENKLSEAETESEGVKKFISKLYGAVQIRRQRNLNNSTVWLIFIQHPKFGRMNILADIAEEVIYQIDFEMIGMAGIVKSGTQYQGLDQENLKAAEKQLVFELERIMDVAGAYGHQSGDPANRLKLLEWRSIVCNAHRRLLLTYQNQKYLLEAEAIYNTNQGQKNKSVNVISFRAQENNLKKIKEWIKEQRDKELNKILNTEDWMEAEKLFKKTQGYYVRGGKIADIQIRTARNQKYYTVRYQMNHNMLEVQLLYRPLAKEVTTMSIIPRAQVTPFILPGNCERASRRMEECAKCRENFYLHADAICYPAIPHCEFQSGVVCIRCVAGYIILERNRCL